ncbi:MAG: hypothetical protein V3T88_01900, partial [Nitrosomonadaceae bacterium]
FNWDGASLAELDKMVCEGFEFQVRITENTYEGARSPFQVSWIDVYDADPVYTLRKLDAKEVKDLDAQFSTAKAASAKTAASAPKSSVKPHPARVPADDGPKKPVGPKDPKKMSKAEKQALMKQKSERIKQEAAKQKQAANAKAAAPTAPPVPEEQPGLPPEDKLLDLPEAEGSITKAEAWAGIFEGRDPTINDKTIKQLWDDAIEEVAGEGAKHTDVTGEQWSQVKKIVLADCGKFE